MATVTPNFLWPVPTPTDLVKDGATAIEALGDSIDASLVDLKGGTTGQVLSKTSGTDMDFTWVTTDDANAIQNSIVDAKGDLISATANDTPARLAVGANGETLVADSSTSTGLRYQGSMPAGKNFAINGGFDIWQRGTSGFSTQLNYTADRWYNTQSSNITGSQGTSNPPDGSRFYFVQTATSSGGYYTMAQFVETANASQLWGRTVSLSIKLKRNATFDGQTVLELMKSATVDAGSGATWTSLGTTTINAASISTSTWTTFTLLNIAIPNDGTANSIQIRYIYNTNPANGSVLNVGQIQLELGSVPTTFTRTGGTIQGELAACQRYYYRASATQAFTQLSTGIGYGTSASNAQIAFTGPVTLRAKPTAIDFSNICAFDGAGTFGISAVTFAGYESPQGSALNCASGSLTTNRGYSILSNNSTAGFIGISAEL
jgi:hypothetical protein